MSQPLRANLILAGSAAVIGTSAWVMLGTGNAWDLLFAIVLLGGAFAVARLVVAASVRARRAAIEAARLAATSSEVIIARALADERARLTADIEVVIQTSLEEMLAAANDCVASDDFDATPHLRRIAEARAAGDP